MPLSLNSLLGLTRKPNFLTAGAGIGAGLLGGAAGYGLGSIGKKKDVTEVQDLFDQYNQEENKQLATEAFMAGAQFALDGEKLSSYVEAGFKDEFQKIAGPRLKLFKETVKGLKGMAKRDFPGAAKAIARAKDGLTLKNARTYAMTSRAAASKIKNPVAGFEGEGAAMAEHAKGLKSEAMKDLGIAGAGVAGAAALGMVLKRALKNPSARDQAMKFISANKGKLAVGAGVGAGVVGTKAILD